MNPQPTTANKKPPCVKLRELPREVKDEYIWRSYSFWRASWMVAKKDQPRSEKP